AQHNIGPARVSEHKECYKRNACGWPDSCRAGMNVRKLQSELADGEINRGQRQRDQRVLSKSSKSRAALALGVAWHASQQAGKEDSLLFPSGYGRHYAALRPD